MIGNDVRLGKIARRPLSNDLILLCQSSNGVKLYPAAFHDDKYGKKDFLRARVRFLASQGYFLKYFVIFYLLKEKA